MSLKSHISRARLESIRNQIYHNIEVIIVDNYSQNDTVKLNEEADAIVYFLDAERAEGKNFGALKANGEFVFFIDSDMWRVREWAKRFSWEKTADQLFDKIREELSG